MDTRIEVVAYNRNWPALFLAERALLGRVLEHWLAGAIEHVGSTAVPGLMAKPVVDIMAPVHSLHKSSAAIAAVSQAGYVYFPYKAEVMHWFCKPTPSYRTHHLHLVPYESPLWFERLAFRDALRRSEALVAKYAALKVRLAAEFPHDRDAYTQAKEPFVRRVLSEVQK